MKKVILFSFLLISYLTVYAQDDEQQIIWSQELHKISEAGIAYELVGKTEESETKGKYEEVFGFEERFFVDEAVFKQRVRLLKSDVRQIDVNISYQVCKTICILQGHDFKFVLDGGKALAVTKQVDARSLAMGEAMRKDFQSKERLTEGIEDVVNASTGLWGIFGLGFLGGLIALLTPCVFPMIPLTVSFFTKQSANRSKGIGNAMLYGLFIVLIYVLLSLPFHLFDSVDSQILNTIATNIWLNLLFFVIFVFFAFSFFGYYELTLPSSWANKMDSASSKAGGAIGIFFMAVTLAIVSFSCTGPILGGLLGSTVLEEGDVANNLTIGMAGFGVALALPFALFALFPAWLNSLPKSGGWMTTVKVVLGFLELALALKFLSNSDLVGHWGILKREIFIGIWIVLFVLLTLYLFGIFRFPHDGPKQKLSAGRKITGLASLAFAVYLVLGLTNVSDLKLLSGFPPPQFYSVFEQESDCPLGINCFKDFDEGVAYAKKANKPILLDFTGWACVNCRKMEENVWSEPDIFPLLKDDYVLISLYVDDRKELPKEKQFDFQYDSGRIKTIATVGQKWGTFQTLNFNAASQPYYVLLSPDLNILNHAIQSTDKDAYRNWLTKGLSEYRLLSKK